MDHTPQTDPNAEDTIKRLTEHVIERAMGGKAEQALLEAAMDLGAAGASIWRPLADSTGGCESWHPVRSRGDARTLPPNSVVQAHFEGRLGCTLPMGALALGGLLEGLGLVIGEPANGPLQGSPDAIAFSSADRNERWRTDCGSLLEALLAVVSHLGAATEIAPEGLIPGHGDQTNSSEGLGGLLPESDHGSELGPDKAA